MDPDPMEIDPLGLPNGQSVSLTTGAAMTAFENRYIFGEIVEGNPEEAVWNQIGPDQPQDLTTAPRIVMQVVGMARLKYAPGSRRVFEDGRGMCYADASRFWGNDTPYRLILSDGEHTIVGKFPDEPKPMYRGITYPSPVHGKVHKLVQTGQLKVGTVIRFVPTNRLRKGIVTIFEMETKGWQQAIGTPLPCHPCVSAFSPSDFHECTVPISPPEKSISTAAVLLAKVIEDKCDLGIGGPCSVL